MSLTITPADRFKLSVCRSIDIAITLINAGSVFLLFQFYDGFDDQSENFLTLSRKSDLNTTRISKSNLMTFTMTVNTRYTTYAGYTMLYSARGKFLRWPSA